MINNRQGGRRRGRGGQRTPNVGGQPGNRQDNRQRGNAAQLLEKYKSMARDAQLGGDRVQAEYYLQFADHYFRVLGESRSRFEDQRRQRGDDSDEDDSDEDIEAGAEQTDGSDEEQRSERKERSSRGGGRPERSRRFQRDEREEQGDGPQREQVNGRARNNGQSESIPLEALPPAIGRDNANDEGEGEEEAPKPRRRTRRAAASDGDGAPASAA